MKHISHGEVNFFKTGNEIPLGAKRIDPKNGMYIVADSETTGNHHYIEDTGGVELFELNGILYMRNTTSVNIKCVVESRHDTIELEPSPCWEIERSLEYDYLTEEIRYTKD